MRFPAKTSSVNVLKRLGSEVLKFYCLYFLPCFRSDVVTSGDVIVADDESFEDELDCLSVDLLHLGVALLSQTLFHR